MASRGRKSKAELSVAPVTSIERIPEPPAMLTELESAIWKTVMTSSAGGYIKPEAYPVLVEYCRATVQGDVIADELSRFDPKWLMEDEGMKRFEKLQNLQDKAARRVGTLAGKLRLSPSSRMHQSVAGTAERNATKSKPWQN